MKAIYVIGAIVLLVVVGAGSFYGGVVYAQSQTQNTASDFIRQRSTSGNANEAAATGPCGFPQRASGGSGQSGQSGGQAGQGGGQGAFQGRPGGNSQFGNSQLGNCVARGTVKTIDGNTIQISTPVNVVTVKIGDKTVISKTDVGALSDLKTGDRVTVYSTETGDSPTASVVQLQRAPSQLGP